MPYRINPRIEEQNHLRSHATEACYVEQLRGRGRLIEIENIAVDAEQTVFRRFQCDSNWCLRRSGNGARCQYKGSCCTDLQVELTAHERQQLLELAQRARHHLSLPARHGARRAMNRLLEDQVFEVTDKGELIFASLSSGRCPLSWLDGGSTLCCSINTVCEDLQLDLRQFKPEPCFLYPLHYVEYRPGRYFLTLITPETCEAIGADRYTARLRCLNRPQPGSPPALVSLRAEIELCFGQGFYQQLFRAARPWLRESGWAPESERVPAPLEG